MSLQTLTCPPLLVNIQMDNSVPSSSFFLGPPQSDFPLHLGSKIFPNKVITNVLLSKQEDLSFKPRSITYKFVTLSKLRTFSGLSFFICKMGVIIGPGS